MKRVAVVTGIALALALAAGPALARDGYDVPRHGGWGGRPRHGEWNQGCPPGPRPGPRPGGWYRPWGGWGYRPCPPPPPVVVYNHPVYYPGYNITPRCW